MLPVRAARSRGLRAANGSEMLIQQAAIAFERWTGVGGMADVMRLFAGGADTSDLMTTTTTSYESAWSEQHPSVIENFSTGSAM